MRRGAGIGIVLIGAGMVLWGLALLASQTYYWLRVGTWPAIATIQVLAPVENRFRSLHFEPYDLVPTLSLLPHAWLDQPSDWYGVNKIVLSVLTGVPLSVSLVIFGLTIWFLGIAVAFWKDDRQ